MISLARSLEEELGKKLFTRHSFNIRLTDEGVLLRERAEDLVSMADKIEKEFVSLDDIAGGELFLGLAESYLIKYIADSIKTLKERYPRLQYHITSGDTEQVDDKLQKGILDFVVLAEEPDAKKLQPGQVKGMSSSTWKAPFVFPIMVRFLQGPGLGIC